MALPPGGGHHIPVPDYAGDVAIVGAGPAGSAAAITLARLGRRVVLIDKATFPRDKCCGDGLTTAAVRRLEHLGLDPTRVASWEPVREVVVVAGDGRTVELPFPTDGTQYAASARRRDLDAALVELAGAAGVQVVEGEGITGAPAEAHGLERVRLETDRGNTVTANYVIGADGMWSALRKAAGATDNGYLGDWQAGRQYYTNVGPRARRLWVWFEPDMAPGYAWSFPLPGGTANVGYGVLRNANKPNPGLRGQRVDLLERPHIAGVLGPDATPVEGWKAWPIPARIGNTALSGRGGRILFAGDAARACDPMTGEGIAQALETGELAARAVAQAGPLHPAVAAKSYERQIKWGLALDDNLSRTLSRILTRPNGSAAALRLVDTRGWCRRNFVRWMFEGYPRAALVTPHRWRRHMFSTAGAFRSAP
jgi:menaquinone-9 beta-reductase